MLAVLQIVLGESGSYTRCLLQIHLQRAQGPQQLLPLDDSAATVLRLMENLVTPDFHERRVEPPKSEGR